MSILAPEPQTVTAPQVGTPEPQVSPIAAPPPADLPRAGRPSIVANRKLLVKRFSSLAFTVSTGGLPYWEVLLFTDRSLIDPANASRRTPANFYSSRQESGLRRMPSTGDDVFLVPSAVLRGFAAAMPMPTAIYFTIAAYASADGSAPVLPAPPEELALRAPYVAVSADFTPDAVGHVLGVPARRLKVVAQALETAPPLAPAPPPTTPVAAPVNAPAPVAAVAPTPATPVDPTEDAAAGEDAFSYYAAHPERFADGPAQQPRPPAATAPAPAPSAPVDDDVPYDDGYGEFDEPPAAAGGEPTTSWRGGADFTAGRHAPEPLGGGAASWAVEPEELDGVAMSFPYRGLDEPEPSNGSGSPAVVAIPSPVATPPAVPPIVRAPLALTIDDKLAIIERVAGSESGSERYGAINADGEFKGRFGPAHAAYRHHHIGLSYGIIQFTQESGNLGRLLVMMRERDPATFGQIFGGDADALVAVTTAAGPASREAPDGRSARTQPVGGADLWEEPWLSRFRQAGGVPAFQAAQNELAATGFIDPMLRFAGDLGLDTDRALTLAIDRAVQMGVNGARHWIAAAVGPISTPSLRQQALTALGFADLGSFQRAAALEADDLWGPVSHAALVGALHGLGSQSPIPLLSVDQMLDAMVRRAEGDGAFWAARVKRLRGADGFTDRPYAR